MNAKNNLGAEFCLTRRLMTPLPIILAIIAIDLYFWHSALGSFLLLVGCFVWSGGRLIFSRKSGKFPASVKILGTGGAALAMTLLLGGVLDRFSEIAARKLATKISEYKTVQGRYPERELVKTWPSHGTGYAQIYSLIDGKIAHVTFEKFNYKLQTIDVDSGGLSEERDL